jgi:hypothetical protein
MTGIRARARLAAAAACVAAGLVLGNVLAQAPTDALFAATSAMRELSILRPVPSSALSRAEIERKVLAISRAQMQPDEIRAAELAMKVLGLAPRDFDLFDTQIKLLTEQVAGLYDPQTREFYLADWIDLTFQKPVIVHELTHALQDQHFDLRRLTEWPDGESDAQLAAHSLVEGDATLAMAQYVLQNPDVAATYLSSLQNAPKMPVFESVPRALREGLVFPFVQGLQFATALHGRGGWKAVSAAYMPLPQSTEQILHLDKYDAREAPMAIAIPDVSRLLGPGWKRLDSDVNGEAGYQTILDQFLMAPSASRRAAAGWGGDRFDVYEGNGGAVVIQMTAWDTEADASEFFEAYTQRTGLRYKQPKPAGFSIERRTSRVLIMEGLPASADPTALARAIWGYTPRR